jgi:hypothetical protein
MVLKTSALRLSGQGTGHGHQHLGFEAQGNVVSITPPNGAFDT